MERLKLIGLMIVVGFGLIVGLTRFFAHGVNRINIVGWICLVFALCVFVAPLGVVKQVIKTKSVEFMPILLSVALTCNAVTWFFYGLLLHDYNIAIPNVLGFTFGVLQIVLYFIYKNKKPVCDEKITKLEEIKTQTDQEPETFQENKDQEIIDIVKLSALVCSIPVVQKLDDDSKIVDDRIVNVEPDLIANRTVEVGA